MIVQSRNPVVLIGGGALPQGGLEAVVRPGRTVVAADGGADAALALNVMPDHVIGDMDSLSDRARARIPAERIHRIAEQDSTDFDKALRNIDAPLVLGLGFLGKRLDHELAAMTVLAARAERRCILIGEEDIVLAAPPALTLDLPVGTRLSLFPMGPVTGRSTGLRWPSDGLRFTPAGIIGTSNETTEPRVSLSFDAPGMLLILPRAALTLLVSSLHADV